MAPPTIATSMLALIAIANSVQAAPTAQSTSNTGVTFNAANTYPNNTFVSPYTLTVFAPKYSLLNGLRIQVDTGLSMFETKSNTYCPTGTKCPTGTDAVFTNNLTPSTLIPGGQSLYTTTTGLIQFTPGTTSNSNTLPKNTLSLTSTMTWYPLPNFTLPNSGQGWTMPDCPTSTPAWYDCSTPVGIYTWASGTAKGLQVCLNEKNLFAVSVYAKVGGVLKAGCYEITGLGTHGYNGSLPAVYSYN